MGRLYTITKVTRIEPVDGGGRAWWTANVTVDGFTFSVDRRYGSWQAIVEGTRRDIVPGLAAALQERIPDAPPARTRRAVA